MRQAQNEAKSTLSLISDLVKLHGPPGQEDEVANYVYQYWRGLGLPVCRDPKGNVVIELPNQADAPDRLSVLSR